ncbi:MAG TPA: hypothetical protein DDW49_05615 [Deltaproteobacteria bacterium]|nr:MAG: hypothetical protein A2048_09130 [Deltaproteobacteria bacterium GWA2_45_12]HBF12851.1 hypothetical protein [Deltaproteobacteria bacterium]
MKPTSVLIDTHILLWILSKSKKLKDVPWIKEFNYLTLSPISLLEIKFLKECGRIDLEFDELIGKLKKDTAFHIDDISFDEVCTAAFSFPWTRDPFDRLLVAHSQVRNIPLGTCDTMIKKHYSHTV